MARRVQRVNDVGIVDITCYYNGSARAVLLTLAQRTVLDRYRPPTRGSTVPHGTDRFRTVPCVLTLVPRTVLELFYPLV